MRGCIGPGLGSKIWEVIALQVACSGSVVDPPVGNRPASVILRVDQFACGLCSRQLSVGTNLRYRARAAHAQVAFIGCTFDTNHASVRPEARRVRQAAAIDCRRQAAATEAGLRRWARGACVGAHAIASSATMIAVGLWVNTGAATRYLRCGAATGASFTGLARRANRGAVTAMVFVGVGIKTNAAARLFVASRAARCANPAVARHAVAAGGATGAAVVRIGLQIGANTVARSLGS